MMDSSFRRFSISNARSVGEEKQVNISLFLPKFNNLSIYRRVGGFCYYFLDYENSVIFTFFLANV